MTTHYGFGSAGTARNRANQHTAASHAHANTGAAMSEYEDFAEDEAAVDDRLSLMQQYVDLDSARVHMEREQKFLEEKLHGVTKEQRKIRERIGNALGFDDPMAGAKASLNAEVQKMRATREQTADVCRPCPEGCPGGHTEAEYYGGGCARRDQEAFEGWGPGR